MRLTGKLTIEGREYLYTLVPVEGAAASESVTAPMSLGVAVTIVSHATKSGMGRNKKPYTIHTFMGSDNKKYQTFDDATAAKLQGLVGSGTPVKIFAEQTQYGWDIQRVEGA